MAEFLSLVFIRSRLSLKYFPRITILIISSFMMGFNRTQFAFYGLQMLFLSYLLLTIFFLFIIYVEIPALDGNPSSAYVVSSQRPRALYFPFFSTNLIEDLPQSWSMFYPLHGREYFSEQQMSYVDQNMILLNQYSRLLVAREQEHSVPEV